MYAQVAHLRGLNCAGCDRALIPGGRPVVTQVADSSGNAAQLPEKGSPEFRAARLVMRCERCLAETPIALDGDDRRIEPQTNAPTVIDPCYLLMPGTGSMQVT